MTNIPTHYFNFKPCEAVQWAGNNGEAIAAVLGYGHRDWTRVFNRFVCAGWSIEDSQWLIRQDNKVWVQDEEPARVDYWHTGNRDGEPGLRVYLSNGWTGPWETVDE